MAMPAYNPYDSARNEGYPQQTRSSASFMKPEPPQPPLPQGFVPYAPGRPEGQIMANVGDPAMRAMLARSFAANAQQAYPMRNAMLAGGDKYTKSAADWAQLFPQPDPTAPDQPPMPDLPPDMGGAGGGGGRTALLAKSEGGMKTPAGMDNGGDESTNQLEALIKKIEDKKEFDFTPLLALTDAWTGSNFTKSYDRPMDEDQRDKIVAGLRSKIQERKDTLDYKREYLAQLADQQDEARKVREEGFANQERIARIAAGSRENVAGIRAAASGGVGGTGGGAKIPTKYRKGLESLAMQEYGDPGNPYDHNYQAMVPILHNQIAAKGKEMEDSGQIPKGQGYDAVYSQIANKLSTPATGPNGQALENTTKVLDPDSGAIAYIPNDKLEATLKQNAKLRALTK